MPFLIITIRYCDYAMPHYDLPCFTMTTFTYCLSAGHTAHPATTAAATEHAFAFLGRAVAGAAAQANSELRAAA